MHCGGSFGPCMFESHAKVWAGLLASTSNPLQLSLQWPIKQLAAAADEEVATTVSQHNNTGNRLTTRTSHFRVSRPSYGSYY
eukprot:scaffold34921_cov162-Amphora_coffeaeformis.AAC.10